MPELHKQTQIKAQIHKALLENKSNSHSIARITDIWLQRMSQPFRLLHGCCFYLLNPPNKKIKGFIIASLLVLPIFSYPKLAKADSAGAYICPLITGTNVLLNPDFQTPGSGSNGTSAAQSWTLSTSDNNILQTELVSSTFPGEGSVKMIHVTTTSGNNGIIQAYKALNTGPNRAISSAWVFVKTGQVGIGVGNGGNTNLDTTSSTTNQWERLQIQNTRSPANEFIIYSYNAPAEFYVAHTCINEVP